MYDYTHISFTVPMWGCKVANSQAEIHIANTASDYMYSGSSSFTQSNWPCPSDRGMRTGYTDRSRPDLVRSA